VAARFTARQVCECHVILGRVEERWLGQPNPYGHPDPNALAELDGVGAQVWRTDLHGTITISFTDQGSVVASERRIDRRPSSGRIRGGLVASERCRKPTASVLWGEDPFRAPGGRP
jgi:hypothetical protein